MGHSKSKKQKLANELARFIPYAGLLLFINLFSSPGYLWCLWAIVPWAFAILGKSLSYLSEEDEEHVERYEECLELPELRSGIQQTSRPYKDSDLV